MSGTIPFPNGGGKGVPPQRGSKMAELIKEIYVVLQSDPPCRSVSDIQKRLKSLAQDVSLAMIGQALVQIRRHPEQYSYAIPHVKRGRASEERRYFAVLRQKGTVAGFTLPEAYRAYSKDGFDGTVSHIATMGKNETIALRMLLQFEKSKARRDAAEELLETLEFIAKRARSLLKRSMNG